MDFRSLALAGILPAALCAAVLLVAWKPWRPTAASARRESCGALGFALAFTLAAGFLLNWPAIPPKESWQWLIYISTLGVLPGVASRLSRRAGLFVALAVAFTSAQLIVPLWQEPRALWVLALSATILILSLSLDLLAQRWRGAALPLTLCMLSCVSGGLLLLSGNVKFALLAFINASCCGVGVVLAAWCPAFTLAGGAISVVALLLPCLLFNGYVFNFSKIPPVCFFLLTLAPIGAWLGQFGSIKRLSGAMSMVAVLIPIIICWILVYQAEFGQP